MTNFKKTYTLIQHTPILHFQHAQGDVVLRATEVKPKLDKFLIKQAGGWKNTPLDWKSYQEDQESLDYKIKIWVEKIDTENAEVQKYFFASHLNKRAIGNIGNVGIPIFPAPYFADAENVKERQIDKCKIGLFYPTEQFSIFLEIFSFQEDLLEKINLALPIFFIQNNFGTRQSKGFGSFTIKGFSIKAQYWFSVNNGNNHSESFKNIFEDIDLFCKSLRGGLNGRYLNSLYFKSIIYKYAHEVLGLNWEKKAIKINFFEENDSEDDTFFLVRDFLGLSNQQKWTFDDGNTNTNYNVTKTHNQDVITRIKAPITIKPFFIKNENIYKIFILHEQISPKILNKTFDISCDKNFHDENGKKIDRTFQISFPKEFSITDFLKYAFENGVKVTQNNREIIKKFDINTERVNRPQDPKFLRIKQILNEIRTNANPQLQ